MCRSLFSASLANSGWSLFMCMISPSVKDSGAEAPKWSMISVFGKAIKELNAQKTADGRPMIVSIEKGLYDWMLTARLGGEEKCLELQTTGPAKEKSTA